MRRILMLLAAAMTVGAAASCSTRDAPGTADIGNAQEPQGADLQGSGAEKPVTTPQPAVLRVVKIGINSCERAFRTFHTDRWVEGSHLSGDAQPFVHMDRKRIPAEQWEAIWRAAEAMPDSIRALRVEHKPEWTQFHELHIWYGDGSETQLSWEWSHSFPSPEVESLMKLLWACSVGGW